MSADAREILTIGLNRLKLPKIDHLGITKLLEFGRAVLEGNRQTNLTGAKDLVALVRDHILDSLAPLSMVDLKAPIVDVGSGAGFPGIPAAIVYPNKEFILLEPRTKRADFLVGVSDDLKLSNVQVLKSSALGPGAAHLAGKTRTVLMRAVATPQKSLGLALGLLQREGHLLLYEGRASAPTEEQRRASKRLGGGPIRVKVVMVPGLQAVRHAWVVEKLRIPDRR